VQDGAVSDDDMAWFGGDVATGMSPVLDRSDVSFFVDADEYYADLRTEVVRAGEQGGDRFVCWIGFEASLSTLMPSPEPPRGVKAAERRQRCQGDAWWGDVLAGATSRGVMVRALLNLHPAPKPPDKYVEANLTTVAELNRLQNTLAIDDFRYLFMNGTHHQKLVVVQNEHELFAYVGSMDVQRDRIADRWCEVGCKVRGEAARELYRVFHSRWVEHTEVLKAMPRERSWLPAPDDVTVAQVDTRLLTQASVTVGRPTRKNPFRPLGPSEQVVNQPHRLRVGTPAVTVDLPGVPTVEVPPLKVADVAGNAFFTEKDPAAAPVIQAAAEQSPHYEERAWTLSPEGRTGIYHQIAAALRRTRHHIYLEDQYLIADVAMGELASMLELLVEKVREPEFRKLIILCTRIEQIEEEFQFQAGPHRRSFLEQLAEAGGEKVVICQYKSAEAVGIASDAGTAWPFYVHSKTWIFDDELAIVGSANCNRRGYSHDTELDFAVYDPEHGMIADLRRRIWLRRLNTAMVEDPVTAADVEDFLSGARFWERPDEFGLTIENNRMGVDDFMAVDIPADRDPDVVDALGWDGLHSYVDPLGSTAEELVWNVVLDPEGT
jgi:phosphatidylserine/phosphatidylglycerophosphate/cardiolipin synthase-like enzyme